MKKLTKQSAASAPKEVSSIYAKSLIAEDLRLEADGKVSALGLYLDDKVFVGLPEDAEDPSRENPALIEGLCILVTMFNLPTETTFQMKLSDPSGIEAARGTAVVAAGSANNTMLKMRPFPVRQLGTWTLSFTSEIFNYSYKFEISKRQLPPKLGPVATKPSPRKRTKD